MNQFLHIDIARLLVACSNSFVPVIYVVGGTYEGAFHKLHELRILERLVKVNEDLGVYLSFDTLSKTNFIAVIRPHPSYSLIDRTRPVLG